MEMRAAAPPPTPLKMATICGIAVILTRGPPARRQPPRRPWPPGSRTRLAVGPHLGIGEGHAHGATAAATAASRLPFGRTSVSSPLRARMNPMAASR